MQTDTKYMLLNKLPSPARSQTHMDLHTFRLSKFPPILAAGPFSLDFEANTNKPQSDTLYTRCAAMANSSVVIGVDFKDADPPDLDWWWSWICDQDLVGYNAMYDHGLIYNMTSQLIAPHADCYIAFKMLGDTKHSKIIAGHSLKDAQVELLDWADKGSDALNQYKTEAGLTWADIEEFDTDILLHYNCLDADSTWALYELFQAHVKQHWDTWGQYFAEWHREDCLNESLLWIEALSIGMDIDEVQLIEYTRECNRQHKASLAAFLTHPQLIEGVTEYNHKYVDAMTKVDPTYRKFKLDGTPTANWIKRQAQAVAAKDVMHFNINSGDQLAWLLYQHAGLTPLKYTTKGGSTDKESLQQLGEVGELLLEHKVWVTELKFLTQLHGSNNKGVLYPNVVFPGTNTGRVSSREDIK